MPTNVCISDTGISWVTLKPIHHCIHEHRLQTLTHPIVLILFLQCLNYIPFLSWALTPALTPALTIPYRHISQVMRDFSSPVPKCIRLFVWALMFVNTAKHFISNLENEANHTFCSLLVWMIRRQKSGKILRRNAEQLTEIVARLKSDRDLQYLNKAIDESYG